MASPQKENGYTAIANEIMDKLMKTRIPGEARQVLDCILRKTYGWNKKQDRISLSQFEKYTGIKKPNIIRALGKLLSMNIIIQKDNATVIQKDNAVGYVYEFNKDFETWRPLSKKITLSKKIKTVIQKDNKSLSKKITTKESIKTNKTTRVPDWLNECDWIDFKDHRKKLKKPMTQRAEEILIAKITHLKEEGFNPRHLIITAIERGWQTVYDPRGEK